MVGVVDLPLQAVLAASLKMISHHWAFIGAQVEAKMAVVVVAVGVADQVSLLVLSWTQILCQSHILRVPSLARDSRVYCCWLSVS